MYVSVYDTFLHGPVFGSKVPVKERKAQTCNCFLSIEYEQWLLVIYFMMFSDGEMFY